MDGIAVKPLTVGFHEGGFLGMVNSENRGGNENASPFGPVNTQALNRYSYVQNNPLKWTDPSGHWMRLNHDQAVVFQGRINQLMIAMHNSFYDPNDANNAANLMRAIEALFIERLGEVGVAIEQFKENVMHILSDEKLFTQMMSAMQLMVNELQYYINNSKSGDGSIAEIWMSVSESGWRSVYFNMEIVRPDGTVEPRTPIYLYKQ